jgi:SAM-dependent methyltransferase
MTANEAERRRWNNAEWARLWPRRERVSDQTTPYLLAALALSPGERVLDIGSGGGRASLAAAAAVGPDGVVLGADVSAPLTALARQRAQEAPADNVSFQLLDVQVDDVPGAPYDAAMSQFGVMFFDEPVSAFANIRAHLRSGGRLAFLCWQPLDRNRWFMAPSLAHLLPAPPALAAGKSPTGPFTLGDADHTAGILKAAGFVDVQREGHELAVEVPGDSVIDRAQVMMMGVSPENEAEALATAERHVAQFLLPSGLCRFRLAFQVFQALNP